MKLGELSSVRSGLVLSRKQSKELTAFEYPLINLRSVLPDGTIDLKGTDIYHATEPLKKEYLSQKGDLVMRLTVPYTAILIDQAAENMVISSNFVVIRVERHLLLPEFLFWFLNTQKVKHTIYENATSNMLGAVNAKFLSNLEVDLPPMEMQKKIAQLNLLARQESQLLKKLANAKETYYAGVLDQVYKSAKRGK